MARAFIEITTDWLWEDADGGECCECQADRYGKQLRMRLFAGGKEQPQECPPILCASCGDLVQSQTQS